MALDLRGHGLSDKPDSGYDFSTLVADLASAVESLGWALPVVAGQSTGGNLAVQLGARYPGAVGAVAGIDGGVLDLASQWSGWEECESALAPPVFTGTPVARIEAHLRARHPKWSDDAVAATLANLEVLPDGTVRPWLSRDRHLRILRGLWEQRPMDLLAELDVPLLLVMAESADEWSAARQRIVEQVRGLRGSARVEWLTGDHDLHVEQPAAVAGMLRELAMGIGS